MTSFAYLNCELCPRRCRIDRGKTAGFCGQTDEPKIARAALHMWEEPCISGKEGSGTVFFEGCTLGCVYCQNGEISRGRASMRGVLRHAEQGCPEQEHVALERAERGFVKTVTPERIAEIFIGLWRQGANNINLVTPTMFSPHIIEAIRISRSLGMNIPAIYNTSCYERPEVIKHISSSIEIWLPDFKYLSPELSAKYSLAADYSEFAKSALNMMVRLSGGFNFDSCGIMTRGVIVRHLLLPGQLAESKRVINYLFCEYGNDIYYSLMNQYTPPKTLNKVRFPELSRRVTTYEYSKLIEYALSLGMSNAFIQDGGAAEESFIPSFNID